MAQHVSLLDVVRRAIRQQTTSIGAVVTNLTGATAGQVDAPVLAASQRWAHAVIPAAGLLELNQVYASWQTSETPTFMILAPQAELPGSVYFIDPAPACHLLVAGLNVVGGNTAFPLTIETASTQSLWAVYVDGSLVRRGSGTSTTLITLAVGAHTLELVLFAASALVTVPANVALTAESVVVSTPTLLSVTTTAADPLTGATSCNLTWVNDPKAGGVRVLRRSVRPVGVVSAVSEVAADRTCEVTFDGYLTRDLAGELLFHQGEELYSRFELIGGIITIAEHGGKSRFVVRLAPDQAALPEALVGQMAWAGAWTEVGRQGRSVAGGNARLEDRTVVFGVRYDYAIQAWSVWNANLWSPYSGSLSVRAGDIEPPGCIEVIGASALGGVLVFSYHTPTDEDYAGVNVYATLTRYGTVREASATQVTLELDPDVPLDAGELNTWTVEVDTQMRTVVTQDVSGVVVFDSEIGVLPMPGDVVTFSKRSKVITDFGLPDQDDTLTVALPQTLTTYEFRSFDRSRNEQDDDDILVCPDAVFVFNPSEFNRPSVFIDELSELQQAGFAAPYDDHRAYSIVLIGARDLTQSVTGVTITVEPRSGLTRSFGASTLPPFELVTEVPPVQLIQGPYVTDTSTSRYYALARTLDINWIVVSATDSLGNRSREYYFATSAPYVRTPEVSLAPSETATEAILDVWVYDPDIRLVNVQFAAAVGDAALSAYAVDAAPVESLDAGVTQRFQHRQPLRAGLTTRIAYRVVATLADGTVGQVAQGVVPFLPGRTPGVPGVSATFDADNTMILQFAGDSDTRSLQWYVLLGVREGVGGYEAQRTVGGTWDPLPTQADLLTLFADPNLTDEANGQFVEFDTGIVVRAGDGVWVAARGCNVPLDAVDWPGLVSQDGDGDPAFATRLFTRDGAYVAPKVQEHIVETQVGGQYFASLTVTVQDPQQRLALANGVWFRRMPGDDELTWDPAALASWYQPGEVSALGDDMYSYTAVVELFEGKLSKIAYAVIGEDEQGDDDAVLHLRTIQCGLGSIPMIPDVSGVVDALGRFALVLNGDSDTVGFRYAISVGTPEAPPSNPAPSAVAILTLSPGRVVQTNTLVTLEPRALVAVTVIAYNKDGVGSEPYQHVWSRESIYVAPDVEELVDETTDFVDGAATAYGVLQLRITDPQARVSLVEFSGMSGNNPEGWDRSLVGTDWVAVWNPASTTTSEAADITRYLYQVLLATGHLSRIQYRVRGTRPDGSDGVLLQSSVAFDTDAKPTIVGLGGHIDVDGYYWPTFSGDSDCRSWVLAVNVGSPTDSATAYPSLTDIESPGYPMRRVYLPPTAEGSLREYPDPDGSPAPAYFLDSGDAPVVVQPGRMLFVTAMAFATNDGGAPSAQYKSQLMKFSALRSAPYVPPQVRIATSETGTSGTLQLYITDPGGLLTGTGAGVFFRKMAGRDVTWETGYSAYAAVGTVGAETLYEAVVTLPSLGAKIGYQVRGKQADNTVGVLANDVISFNPSAVPGAPVVQLLTDSLGVVRALVSSDSDTTHLRAVFSTVAAPLEAAVDLAASVAVTAGQTVLTWGTTVLPRDVIYVGVKAYNEAEVGAPASPLVPVSGEASTLYVRPTVLEILTETDSLGTLEIAFVDDQHWLRTVTLKRQTGTGTWSSRSVAIDALVSSVVETVDLAARKTSRIQYELYGIREDGSNGLISTAMVEFRPGATPGVPTLHAFTTANGQLIVEVVGDSDTDGARFAVRKSSVALTKSDVLGTTSPAGILRSTQGGARILRWTIPTVDFDLDPGDIVSIAAVAYTDAACSDDTLSSDVGTLIVTRNTAYLNPVFVLSPSETAVLATLAIGLTDQQLHVQAVEAQTKAGRGSWSVWTTVWTRGVSLSTTASVNATVALVEGVPSFVRVRATGVLGDGTTGTMYDQTMAFAAGTTPAVPSVQVEVTPTGVVNVTFLGDSDTGSFKYGVVACASNASTATLDAAAAALTLGSTFTGRVARLTNVGSASGSTGLLVVVQAASGSAGLGELSATRAYAVGQPPAAAFAGVINTLARVTTQALGTVTVVVTADNAAQVKLVSHPSNPVSAGAAAGSWTASPATWVFDRDATVYGAVEFEGGNVALYGATRDVLSIAPQRDYAKPAITLTTRIVATNFAAGTITYGVTLADSSGTNGPNFTLTTAGEGLTGFTGSTFAVNAGLEYNVVVTLPAVGTSPGMLRLRGAETYGAYVDDIALLTVPALATLPRPTFTEETSELADGTIGTLTVRSNDPYAQVLRVETRKRDGGELPNTWSGGAPGWSTATGTVVTGGKTYTRTANTAPKQLAIVEWRAFLVGDTDPFAGGSVRFSPGRIPAAPDVTVTLNTDGSYNLEVAGDSDAATFKYRGGLGVSALPDPATGTTDTFVSGRKRISNLGGAAYVALGATVVVGVYAINSSGAVSPVTYGMVTNGDATTTGKRQSAVGAAFTITTVDVYGLAGVSYTSSGRVEWNSGDTGYGLIGVCQLTIPANATIERVGAVCKGAPVIRFYPTQGGPSFQVIGPGGGGYSTVESFFGSYGMSAAPGSYLYFEMSAGDGVESVYVEYSTPSLRSSL